MRRAKMSISVERGMNLPRPDTIKRSTRAAAAITAASKTI
jgi:hypothetical protein